MRTIILMLLITAVACAIVTLSAFAQTPSQERIQLGKAPAEFLATTAPTPTPSPTPTPAVSQNVTPLESLRSAKLIYVHSESVLVGQSVIETKLRNRPEFQQLGLMITRDRQAADLILEVKHDILTKYVFTAVDPRTNVVVASGKLSSLGGTVAGKVAERFLKQLMKARLQS